MRLGGGTSLGFLTMHSNLHKDVLNSGKMELGAIPAINGVVPGLRIFVSF